MGSIFSSDDNSDKPIINVRGRFYRLLDVVGQGGEATVYRCEDQNAIQYAVKVFYYSRFAPHELPSRIDKFHKEARILKFLSNRSQHFVRLYSYQYRPEENVGYMIMELGDGSLRNVLASTPMTDGLRRYYWKQIVNILNELQDAHVVHADIKPDNMILVNNIIKVTDLGLAFRVASSKEGVQRTAVRGTLDYMAPEIFAHQTGFKSDVWSAGIILYEMTYGRPPYWDIMDRNQKIAAISSRTPILFSPIPDRYLMDCMKTCLRSNIQRRATARHLRVHPYTRS